MPTSNETPNRHDVIIIGAGIIGCAIALSMTRKGYKTLNVDALPAAGYGSTSSSAAVIRTYYSTRDGTAMALEGYHDWKNWQAYLETEDAGELAHFIETGTLVMKTASDNYQKHVLEHADALGIPYEHWSADRITQELPGYNLDCFAPAKTMDDDDFGMPTGGALQGGVFFPAGGYVDDSQIAARNLKDAAAKLGAQFRFKTRIVKIPVENNRVTGVLTENGEHIPAAIVINVAGPHSGKVNALLEGETGLKIGHRPLRQEVVQIAPPQSLNYSREGLVVSDNDISVYVKPGGGGQLMIGSQNPACDPHLVEDPDLPIYDRTNVDGYYLAIGTSGNQFKNATVAGRLMTDLIGYCEAGNDHDAKPLQFKLEHVPHTLNTATFSRKRELTKESSFSVLG